MGFLRRLFGAGTVPADSGSGQEIGRVEDYFAKVGVIAFRLGRAIEVGDRIRVEGHTTGFSQKVKSIQIDHAAVERAQRGASIGIKVGKRCRRGDRIYKIAS